MSSLDSVQVPSIRYAANARGKVAYQEFGSGPTLVIVPPLAQHIEMMWEQPAFWRPLQRLASGFRIVIFDKLGTGTALLWEFDAAFGAGDLPALRRVSAEGSQWWNRHRSEK